MDTLLILRDTITANIVKVTDSCSHCVQEAETNCDDVKIIFLICATIVVALGIVAVTFYRWQSDKYKHLNIVNSQKDNLENTKTTYITNNPNNGDKIPKETMNEQLRYKAISELSGICKIAIAKDMGEDMGLCTNIIDKIYSIYQEGIRVSETGTNSTEKVKQQQRNEK